MSGMPGRSESISEFTVRGKVKPLSKIIFKSQAIMVVLEHREIPELENAAYLNIIAANYRESKKLQFKNDFLCC